MQTLLKPIVAAAAFAGAVGSAGAAAPAPQYGTVVSSTPVVVQSSVPRQQCVDEPGYVQTPTSGGGAVVGGILGGLAGNAIGAGAGRAVATGIGAIAGAVVGNQVEASNAPPTPVTTTRCVYSRADASQVVGYDVVYEFNGQRYTTRTARDPGTRIALDVRPAASSPYDAPPPGPSAYATDPAYPPDPSAVPSYPPGPAYPAAPTPYTDTRYGYPPFDSVGYPLYPAPPVYIDARIGGGGRGRHWH